MSYQFSSRLRRGHGSSSGRSLSAAAPGSPRVISAVGLAAGGRVCQSTHVAPRTLRRRQAKSVPVRRQAQMERADAAQLALPFAPSAALGRAHPTRPAPDAQPLSPQQMVWDFHRAFGLPARARPSANVSQALADLRIRLQEEETAELGLAIGAGDLTAIADALADLVYVAYGTAVTYGIDLDSIIAEVHASNMSKLDASGSPVMRDDGKVLKSELYRPPDVARVLALQMWLPDVSLG